MRKTTVLICLLVLFLLFGLQHSHAEIASLSVFGAEVRQGDPFLVVIDGTEVPTIKKLTFDGKKIPVFTFENKQSALIGIDLKKKPGTYTLRAEFSDGSVIKKDIEIKQRDKTETPLGIPEKLGGNTKKSEDKLVVTLNEEWKSLAGLRTNAKALWKEKFTPPLLEMVVTSPYGNNRKTGEYSIPHKGADYKAKIGTEIFAVNRGVVRVVQTTRNYGKTIAIDHGKGVMSFYLHLSKMKVKVGQVVERGKVIALSGDTGYTEGPHLHFAIRINDIAIDPVKFFELFK